MICSDWGKESRKRAVYVAATVIDYNPNAPATRNDFTGYVGLQFSVGAAPHDGNGAGAAVRGRQHRNDLLEVVNAGTGMVVGSMSLNTATACTGLTGQFAYVTLSSSIALPAHSSYYLLSQETSGGDQWYNLGSPTTASAAADTNFVYSSNGTIFTPIGSANTSYVPVNLLYQ